MEETLPIQATAEECGDPANGVEKRLKVDYTLDGVDGTMAIEDGAVPEDVRVTDMLRLATMRARFTP